MQEQLGNYILLGTFREHGVDWPNGRVLPMHWIFLG